MKLLESQILKNIHLKLLILAAIVTPTVTVTGAYWKVNLKVEEKHKEISDRISAIELSTQKNFVDKEAFDSLSDKVDQVNDTVIEIRTILQQNQAARHR